MSSSIPNPAPFSSRLQIEVAEGQDKAYVSEKVIPLVARKGRAWENVLDGKGIKREFRFKGFNKCWAFMDAVAEQCKLVKHHPEWWNSYNRTIITWTTHNPEGLTSKDVEMAEFCDERAREFNEVGEDESVMSCTGVKKGKDG